MALDEAGVSQILAAVGRAPACIDPKALKVDLESAWQFFSNYEEQSRKGIRSKYRKLAQEISKSAGDLAQLLDNPKHSEWVLQNLGPAFPPCEGMPVSETQWDTGPAGDAVNIRRIIDPLRRYEQPSFQGLKAGLLRLRDCAETAEQRLTTPSAWREKIKMTPLTWLVGHDLATVYEQHFHKSAGISRQTGVKEPNGPYIRFSIAVIGAFGKTISAHTVVTAIKDGRKLRDSGLTVDRKYR